MGIKIPWRVDGLVGASTSSGRTYNGGSWTGGGPVLERHLTVRLWAAYGQPATVEVDMGDSGHGCTVSLEPEYARAAAAALIAAADLADADRAQWRKVVEANRAELAEMAARAAEGAAGL